MHPTDRRVVAVLEDQILRVLTDRMIRVVEHFGPGDDRQPFVEELDHRSDHAGLALTPFAKEDHIVSGKDGVLQLGENGFVVAEHAGEQGLPRRDAGDCVSPEFLFDRDGRPAGRFELSEGRR